MGRQDLKLVVGCIGPGGYTGLRVGLTVARTLAHALEIRAIGVPRLRADAQGWLGEGPVCAVHRAGRLDLATALYERTDGEVKESAVPTIAPVADFGPGLPPSTLVVGEVPDELISVLSSGGYKVVTGLGAQRRPLTVALLGLELLADGADANPGDLLPVYLRPAVRPPN